MDVLADKMSQSIGPELSAIGQDLAEISIDSVMNEGLFKEIPIVNSVVSFAKVGIAVRDRLYIHKLLKFLHDFETIDEARRVQFIKEELSDDSRRKRFGETILSLIDKTESDEKITLYARIFEFYFLKKCTYDEALRLCFMVDKSFYSDLLYLLKFKNHSLENQLVASELYKNGFLSYSGIDGGGVNDGGGMLFNINKYGEYLQLILKHLARS